MKKNVLAFVLTAILLLPLGCRNNYRLGMEAGPWGLPMVKLQKTSKIPSNVDPFIKNEDLKPPRTFRTDFEATNPESNLRNDSKIRQAGYEASDPSKNPFAN